MYSGIFNNPFMIWGKMDGAHAAKSLDRLQQEINKLLV